MKLIFFAFILLLVIFIAALVIVNSCETRCSSDDNYVYLNNEPQYSTDLHTVGHRPSLGDYLPTVGNTATGEDNMVEESDAYVQPLNSILCEECISHCVNWATLHGDSTDLPHDRAKCSHYCKIECDPLSGF